MKKILDIENLPLFQPSEKTYLLALLTYRRNTIGKYGKDMPQFAKEELKMIENMVEKIKLLSWEG